MNDEITKIRIAVQWCALLLLVLCVLVGLIGFGVITPSVELDGLA